MVSLIFYPGIGKVFLPCSLNGSDNGCHLYRLGQRLQFPECPGSLIPQKSKLHIKILELTLNCLYNRLSYFALPSVWF